MMAGKGKVGRREAINLLGAGAALGVVSAVGERLGVTAQGQGLFTSTQKVTFPKGAIIRTLVKDLPPEALANGATLFHEHLVNLGYSSPPRAPGEKPAQSDSREPIDLLVDEMRAAARDGVGCLVDAMFAGRRRAAEIDVLKTVEARSGVRIVMAGGYFKAPYPAAVTQRSEDEIAAELTSDAQTQRWGAFGEIGTSAPDMHPDERKVLRAVAKAHLRTGVPIFTHVDHQGCAKCAIEQLDLFESAGVNLRTLCIGHLSDITPEQDPGWQTHKAVAKRGAFLGLDTVGRALALGNVRDIPEAQKVKMVMSILDAGFEDQLLLSADFASSVDLKANWGNGFSTVLVQFVPKLRHAGVKEATIQKILVDNPRRFLAFVPKLVS